MERISPFYTADLFPPLNAELITLLRGLSPDDWQRPTFARRWRVRDVVAHLLDGDVRKLSAYRDGHIPAPPGPIESYSDLMAFLNALNADWVHAAQRLSPRLMVELLSVTGPMLCELMESLPPHGKSLFPVNWAGETESENWFDIGREYTERWHHQMQIREAVGAPGLMERRWLYPLFDISFRALPHAYRALDAPDGTVVLFEITDDAAEASSLSREDGRWLFRGAASTPRTAIRIDPDPAWKLLYNAISADEARPRLRIEGDAALAEPLLAMRTIMI